MPDGDAFTACEAGVWGGEVRSQPGGPTASGAESAEVASLTDRPSVPPTGAGPLFVSEALPRLLITWEKAGAPDLASLVDAVQTAMHQDRHPRHPQPLAAAFALAPLSPSAARAAADAAVCAALMPLLRALAGGAQRVRALLEIRRWRGVRTRLLAGPCAGLTPCSSAPPDARGGCVSPTSEAASVFIGAAGPIGLRAASSVQQYDRLPPPRTSGACFSPTGLLITFSNSPSPYAALSESEAPRSYHDFLGLVQGLHLTPIVRSQLATAERLSSAVLRRRAASAAEGGDWPAAVDGSAPGDAEDFLFADVAGRDEEEADEELLELRDSILDVRGEGAMDASESGLGWLDGCAGTAGAHVASYHRRTGLDGFVSFLPGVAVGRQSSRAMLDAPQLHAAPPPLAAPGGTRAAPASGHKQHGGRGPPAARLRLSWGRRRGAAAGSTGGKGREGVRSKSRLRLLRSLGAMPASLVHAYDAAAALEVGMELVRGCWRDAGIWGLGVG